MNNDQFNYPIVQDPLQSMQLERREIPNGDQSAEKMTKREKIAMAAMQGFAGNAQRSVFDGDTQACSAVLWADALLAALEQKA
ncbi:hypothetical protein OM948_08725 [Xanthomonas citri pv. fuscans]|uniref:hypothetical protein n=1 Tax=Xanthomonas citri TaxID=346 RepID=UPI002225CEC7|nr:hypothetical protein [Xanthomonas citri]UZB05520.1 hypothetical protein OM948_08725 [Xanthomonas citri pv. fuscans]